MGKMNYTVPTNTSRTAHDVIKEKVHTNSKKFDTYNDVLARFLGDKYDCFWAEKRDGGKTEITLKTMETATWKPDFVARVADTGQVAVVAESFFVHAGYQTASEIVTDENGEPVKNEKGKVKKRKVAKNPDGTRELHPNHMSMLLKHVNIGMEVAKKKARFEELNGGLMDEDGNESDFVQPLKILNVSVTIPNCDNLENDPVSNKDSRIQELKTKLLEQLRMPILKRDIDIISIYLYEEGHKTAPPILLMGTSQEDIHKTLGNLELPNPSLQSAEVIEKSTKTKKENTKLIQNARTKFMNEFARRQGYPTGVPKTRNVVNDILLEVWRVAFKHMNEINIKL